MSPPPFSNQRRRQLQQRPQQDREGRPNDDEGRRCCRCRRGRPLSRPRPWLLLRLLLLLLLIGATTSRCGPAATAFSVVETSRVLHRRHRRHPSCQGPRPCCRRSSLSLGSSSSSSFRSSSEAVPGRDGGNSIDEEEKVGEEDDTTQQQEEENAALVQWNLFVRHHVGRWNGLWTTVNDMADVIDETTARAHLELVTTEEDGNINSVSVVHTHEIPVVSTASDCDTCFNNPEAETKTIQVATHRPDTLLASSKIRLASRALVVGPKVLPRSGMVALEVGVRYQNCRARATILMAPAWEPGVEPMSCLPQALKVARVTLHRELLDSEGYHPTPASEEAHFATLKPEEASSVGVRFHRGVPPFAWHRNWHGTSWTWGPQTGNRGWQLDALELDDQWHGNNPVERWNWRSQSVFVQLPKLVTNDETALFRLAWLADPHHLLRVEAGITALRPVFGGSSDDDNEIIIGLEPPQLVSLRCDTLQCDDDDKKDES